MPTLQLSSPNGTWSAFSGGTPLSYKQSPGSCGGFSSGLVAGGSSGAPSYTNSDNCEKFNGTLWTVTGSLPRALDMPGLLGTSGAALSAGGNNSGSQTDVYLFNGSTWSSSGVGQLSVGRRETANIGVTNAALLACGYNNNASTYVSDAIRYNGSTWSTAAPLSQATASPGGVGTATNAMVIGTGRGQAVYKRCELYDGSSWSIGPSTNNIQYGAKAVGTRSSALAVEGSATETFNGTAWTVATAMGSYRTPSLAGMIGESTNALLWGGTSSASPMRFQSAAPGGGASLSVNEGALANSSIATLSASEAGMVFTKVAGTGDTDNASFNISGSDLITLENFDYEAKSSYSVRIQASNGSTTYQNVVTINVSNVNEAPSNITLSAASIQEGNAVNAVIGQLSAIDPDTGDTSFTFSISGGADAAKFNISGNDLRASQAFDYEAPADANADNVYVVEVTAQDVGGLTYSKSFNISVSNNAADDSVTVSSSQVVTGTGGKVTVSSANNPTTIPFLLNGSAIPVGSVVRWSAGSNQKFLKITGNSTAFKAMPITIPASWKWDAAGQDAWDVLQNF